MGRCEDEQMWRWADVKMRRCEDEKVWRWEGVKMRRCEEEQMWRWADVKMSRCEDEQIWRWADVKMRRCEDEKVWRWDAKKSRCEDEKVWRWEGVRWEDVKMRRCEDEQMWRWEGVREGVKMRRWDTDPHYWKNPALIPATFEWSEGNHRITSNNLQHSNHRMQSFQLHSIYSMQRLVHSSRGPVLLFGSIRTDCQRSAPTRPRRQIASATCRRCGDGLT